MKIRADHFWTALRVGIGALFIYASLNKIITPGEFAHEVHNYRLLPVALVNGFAIAVPWLELLCGLALVARRWMEGATLLVTLMMTAFTIAVGLAVARDLNISCGCFKSGGSAVTWMTVARDAVLTAATAALMGHAWRREPRNSRI